MDRTEDLDSALSFVIDRIAEEAKLTGEPLSDEQRLLLKHLPSAGPHNWYLGTPVLVPRDVNLERVCALGKAAYQHDRRANPASLNWEFALAVFTLNQNPMRGLLQWLGMKILRPKWDGVALIVTAFLPLVVVGLIVLNVSIDGYLFGSVGIGSGGIAIMLWMLFAARRVQRQRLEEEIEKCKLASHFVGTATS